MGREIGCQCYVPTATAYPSAPKKRSHSSLNIMNGSFTFYVFLENKEACSVRVGIHSENFSSGRGISETVCFDVSLCGRHRSAEAGIKQLTAGQPGGAAPDLRLPCEAVCSLFSPCMKLMEFAVD